MLADHKDGETPSKGKGRHTKTANKTRRSPLKQNKERFVIL